MTWQDILKQDGLQQLKRALLGMYDPQEMERLFGDKINESNYKEIAKDELRQAKKYYSQMKDDSTYPDPGETGTITGKEYKKGLQKYIDALEKVI